MSNKKTTALQDLIAEINILQRLHPDQHQYDLLEVMAKKKLPTERQQIEEIYSHGDLDGRREVHDRDYKDHADYFTSTYETP